MLYTRAGCHLCEDMFTHLQRLRKQRDFSLELIDVDHQTAIQTSHGTRVPVLETADGECLSEYFLDEVGLLNYLDGG
ncbi:MAG: glutaredoxin family protein [Pseudomonadota bacterium]